LIPQFTKLTGSLGNAERRLKEIAKYSRGGVYKFDDVASASKKFITLTRGALDTRKGLDLAANGAAVAGTSMANAAAAIGDLYDAVTRDPQAIGAQVEQLRAMGIISTSTADQIRNLAASGAGSTAVWAASEAALKKNNGAAAALKNTIAGLQQNLDNVKADNLASIGEMFAEGEMAGARSAVQFYEAFGPVLRDLLQPVAAISNGFAKASESLSIFFTQNKGLVQVIGAVTKLLVGFLGILTAVSAVQTIKMLLGLVLGLGKIASVGAIASKSVGLLALGFRFLGASIYKALGPLGLLAVALQTVLSLAGAKGMTGQGLIGDMSKSVADESGRLKEQIAEIQSGRAGAGAAGENTGAALDNREVARKNRIAAGENVKNSGMNTAMGALSGAATGAVLGSMIPGVGTAIGAVSGALVGGFMGYQSGQKADAQYAEALAQENSAEGIFQLASKQMETTPTEFLNNPAFEAQKAKAKQQMDALNADRAKLDADRTAAEQIGDTKAVEEIDKALEDIAGKMKGVAANFSPEAIQKEFQKQMTTGEGRVNALQSMAQVTGRSDLREQADKEQDELVRMSAAKKYQDAGVDAAQAGAMADRDVDVNSLARMQQRNPVIASGLAQAGGAAGEVSGGPDERQLAVQQRILDALTSVAPSIKAQPDYEGHTPQGS
jgi:uncharacterized membrane protein